ncbi:hypothetical protein R84B8_02780 [Treponema sp. R8-4-B8]
MKKTGFFTLLFIFLCAGVWGGDYTWTGGVLDDDWNNPLNWEESGSPTTDCPGENDTNDNVIIGSGASVTLTDDVPYALGSLEIDGADLDLGGFSLTVDTLKIKNNANVLNFDASLLTVATLEIDNASFELTNSLLTVDTLNFISGNLDIDSSSVLTVTGIFTQDDGNINLTGGTIEAGNITQTGGTIDITGTGNLKSDSNITQTTGGIITGDKLILDAAGAITLTEANEVAELEITGAGGTVQFANNVALEVAGISGVGNNDVTITVTTGGITQSAIIETSGTLSLDAAGAITLTEANEVVILEITGAGDAVEFANNGDLDVAGISVVSGNNVTITVTNGDLIVDVINSGGDITLEADGNITIGIGGITVTGVVKLEASGDITVSGKITANQLIAIASGAVTVDEIEIDLLNHGNEGLNAAIYIEADTFAVTATTSGSIIPGGPGGQLCLVLNNQWTDTYSVVDGARWHQHITQNIISKHLVYYNGSAPPNFSNIFGPYNPADYTFIDFTNAVNNVIDGVSFTVVSPYNIYIIDVGIAAPSVAFKVIGSGTIEIHGVYESSSLSLEPGTGGVKFVDAEVKITVGDFDNAAASLMLDGTENSITAANIKLNAVNGGGNLFTLTGNVIFNEAVNDVTYLTVTGAAEFYGDVSNVEELIVNGNTAINKDITTTGNQTYNGIVILGDDVELTSISGLVELGEIDGNNNSFKITGNAQFNEAVNNVTNLTVTGTAEFSGEVSNVAELKVGGAGTISANITTTGDQTYAGVVTLGSAVILKGDKIHFESTVDSDSTERALTIIAATVQFDGEAGGVNQIASVSVTGLSVINANITTAGDQTYNGTVTLGDDVTFTGNAINFKDTVDSDNSTGRNLTITAVNVQFDGAVGGDPSRPIASVTVTGASVIGADITTTGNQTYNGTVTLAGTGARKLTSSGGEIATTGTVTAANGITVDSHGNIIIGGGGINAGTTGTVSLKSGAEININGSIEGYQLTAMAGNNVNVAAAVTINVTSSGDHDSPPGDGLGAAIYIEANDFKPVEHKSITPGTGTLCLELAVEYAQDGFDDYVIGIYHVHNLAAVSTVKSLVCYNGAISTTDDFKDEFKPADYHYIDISDSSSEYTVNHDKNIVIYKIGNTNKEVTFTVNDPAPTGSITIYGEYSADNLILNPGTGGVLLKDANVEIKAGNFNITNVPLTLDGTADNSIKAINITLSNVIANGKNLTLEASGNISIYEIANGKNLTLKALGAISIGLINADVVLFGGGLEASPLEISVLGELGNTVIMKGSYVKVEDGGYIVQADGKTLEIEENAVLDISTGSWRIGNGTSAVNSFTGYYGELKLGEDSNLITNNFNLIGASVNTFTVNNSGWAAVSVLGDEVNIGNSVNLRPSGGSYAKFIIKMDGNGDQTLASAQILGSLHIGVNSYTRLKNNLGLSGGMYINNTSNTQGVLDAGSYNITLYAETSGGQKDGYSNPIVGRWRVDGVTETISTNAPVYDYPMSGAFRQEPGGYVEFKKGALDGDVFFEIIGNTVWQKFICREAGAVIQFSMYPDQHVFLDTFEVKGASDNHITLTRYIDADDAAKAGWSIIYDTTKTPNGATDGALIDNSLPSVPVMRDLKNESAPYVELSKFWNFNVISTGVKNPLDIDNLTIYFSHAWNQKAPVSSAGIDVIPFYKGAGANRKGYFNYDWGSEGRAIIYSFAEDGNGNGKVDRIRVQTNVRLNADFRNFNVEVEGYRVDAARGQSAYRLGVLAPNGFDLVSRITGDEADDGSFYIYIEESDTLYDGAQIIWRVTQNNSLTDITLMLSVGTRDSGEVYKTTSTIPPRVSYALTLPGHPQTFAQMSQPVSSHGGALTINGNRRSGTQDYAVIDRTPPRQFALEYNAPDEPPKQYNVNIPEGSLNYLLELDSPPSAASLAALPPVGINVPGEYFTLDGLKDLNVRVLDWSDPKVDDDSYFLYPPPRYPIDWNYSRYAGYSGNSHVQGQGLSGDDNNVTQVFLPPFDILTPEMMRRLETYAAETAAGASPSVLRVTPDDFADTNIDNKKRRSTDVLVSITPQDGSSLNCFAWPVWARYDVVSSGVVWEFDGTKYLEDSDENDIAVQVRLFNINDFNALGFNSLSLFYGFEVPVEWRNPAAAAERGKSTGGLWLPRDMSNNKNPLFNIVPDKTIDIATGRVGFFPANNSPVTAAGQLFTFDISKSDFSNGGKIEFVLRLEGNSGDPNLFIARLDAPPGVIPSDWYARIRTFSFDILNTRQQRGGVTILNNVINSDKKEITYIRYNLPRSGRVTVQIYTLDGTLVKSIRRNEQREAGTYVDTWDGSNNGGRAVARGMYFVRVVGPDIDEIRKIMVVK